MPNDLKIGELAKRTGCLVETVRYYEKEQLLPQQDAPTATSGYITKRMSSACNLSVIAARWT